MPGIEDLTDIMVTGGRQDLPMSPAGAAPMAPTAPQPPPLPTGNPAAMESLMANADMLGAGTERSPMEGAGGGGIEQDAMALADAVVGRAQGDIGAAVAILDGAKELLLGSEQPLMANSGMPLTKAGQSELDTRMKKIRDYEEYTPDKTDEFYDDLYRRRIS